MHSAFFGGTKAIAMIDETEMWPMPKHSKFQ